MIFRLRTSKETEELLAELKSKHTLTPNIISRLAVGISLKQEPVTKEYIESITKKIDNSGLEFQRHTLTGENEIFYKVLIFLFYLFLLWKQTIFPQ